MYWLTLLSWLAIVFFLFIIMILTYIDAIENSNGNRDLDIFKVVLTSGGIGGAIISLIETNNHIRVLNLKPTRHENNINLGFISDILLGMVASITFYYLLFFISNFQFENIKEEDLNITLAIPLSIISGASGRVLLFNTSNKFKSQLYADLEEQKEDIEIHYLFNRALAYISNDKPFSAIEILSICKDKKPYFDSSYLLEALCQLEMIKIIIKESNYPEVIPNDVSKRFSDAYHNIDKGIEISKGYLLSNKKIKMIEFGYRIRELNIKIHEVAINNKAYDENGIDLSKLKGNSKLNDILDDLRKQIKSQIDTYCQVEHSEESSDNAKRYIIEELPLFSILIRERM